MKKIRFQMYVPKDKFEKNLLNKKLFNNFKKNIEKDLSLKKNTFSSFNKNFNLKTNTVELNKFKKRYRRIVVIGMGGSILGIEAIYCFLKKKINKEIIFLDNLDVSKIKILKGIKNLENSLFLIISKSGNTIETLATIESLKNAKLSKKILLL